MLFNKYYIILFLNLAAIGLYFILSNLAATELVTLAIVVAATLFTIGYINRTQGDTSMSNVDALIAVSNNIGDGNNTPNSEPKAEVCLLTKTTTKNESIFAGVSEEFINEMIGGLCEECTAIATQKIQAEVKRTQSKSVA